MNQRHKLEQSCRYITRPAIANERLKLNGAGDVVLQLKSPYQDGTTHIVMSPLEFMQRLAALVPRPRLNLIRFHGVLAPNAKLRPQAHIVSLDYGTDRLALTKLGIAFVEACNRPNLDVKVATTKD